MKSKMSLLAIITIAVFTACNKSDMMDDSLDVDIQKYGKQLTADYSNASYYHNILSASGSPAGGHESHHTGDGNTTTIDTIYNMMMFNTNDSLFSEHFYEFCMDMMQNSGMMGTSNGMMGNNSGMMGGSGGMMNGTNMGSMADMNEMMSYMDSLHNSTQTMMNPDYMRTDSLMHNQMTQCKMMVTQTDSIENTFKMMQSLRLTHRMVHND